MTTSDLGTLLREQGLDVGAESALAAGMNLDETLTTCMELENTTPRLSLVALCRAGANPADLRGVAMVKGISPIIFASAMDTCAEGTDEQDTQAYTPVAARVTAQARNVGTTTPPEPYASPSTF
ncbi:MAG: hypothetical protein PF442_11010 [Desulfobulbaceae bacterium]|nr:hypothetical protein [Desulfobulbaceae bacterium]